MLQIMTDIWPSVRRNSCPYFETILLNLMALNNWILTSSRLKPDSRLSSEKSKSWIQNVHAPNKWRFAVAAFADHCFWPRSVWSLSWFFVSFTNNIWPRYGVDPGFVAWRLKNEQFEIWHFYSNSIHDGKPGFISRFELQTMMSKRVELSIFDVLDMSILDKSGNLKKLHEKRKKMSVFNLTYQSYSALIQSQIT